MFKSFFSLECGYSTIVFARFTSQGKRTKLAGERGIEFRLKGVQELRRRVKVICYLTRLNNLNIKFEALSNFLFLTYAVHCTSLHHTFSVFMFLFSGDLFAFSGASSKSEMVIILPVTKI